MIEEWVYNYFYLFKEDNLSLELLISFVDEILPLHFPLSNLSNIIQQLIFSSPVCFYYF